MEPLPAFSYFPALIIQNEKIDDGIAKIQTT